MRIDVSLSVTESGATAPDWSLEADLSGVKTLQDLFRFTKSALIQISEDALREEQARGFDEDPITIVDGSFTKDIQDVDPLGKIEFHSRKVTPKEILFGIYDKLFELSPVDTGFYRAHHVVTHNGAQVASDPMEYTGWVEKVELKPGDIVRFVNIVPYARKLERMGTIAGRRASPVKKYSKKKSNYPQEIYRPNGAYYLTARWLRRKFRANVPVFFGYLTGDQLELPIGYMVDLRGRRLRNNYSPRGMFGRNSAGRPYLYPTISIVFGKGVTFE